MTMLTADLQSLLTVIVAGFIAPVVVLQITGRQARAARLAEGKQAREDKERDWARQDKVAEKAAAVAAAALEAQRVAIVRTEEAAKVAADIAEKALETQQHALTIQKAAIARADEVASTGQTEMLKIMEQVNATHALVNSDMTEARKLELEAVRSGAKWLSERIELGKKQGQQPEPGDVAELAQKHKRIDELEQILAARAAVLVRVEAEQDKDRAAVERSTERKGTP